MKNEVESNLHMRKLDSKAFEKNSDGDTIQLYALTNSTGIEVYFTNYGQRLISLYVPDKHGNFDDIVLGFSNLEDYAQDGAAYFGATIGRYGNRIAGGVFSIDGTQYHLAKNNGPNHLHGGLKGFDQQIWNVEHKTKNEISFSRMSPDSEEGYPGNLMVKVRYVLTDSNALQIFYEATSDKKTVVNLTHHSFFNLKGEGQGTVEDHMLTINADHYTPVDQNLIPNGKIAKVAGTPMDFTTPKLIGKDVEEHFEQLEFADGYDHNYVLNQSPKDEDGLWFAARVEEPNSGRILEVHTNEPGIQFYGGNFLDGTVTGKSGKKYLRRGAFCLETQHYPNSPNEPNFPSTILKPGETYSSVCVYRFSVAD